jgi:uncharacterized membrane protein YfcA
MTLPVSAPELAIGMAIAVLGAFVQGTIGFGLAVVAAPILLLINIHFVPGSLLVAALLLSLMMIAREPRAVAWHEVGHATAGRVVTALPAAWMVARLDPFWFNNVFAIAVLVAVAMSLCGWRWKMSPTNVAVAGAISGITGTISSIGGPPMAIVYQHQRGPHMRATLSAVFTIGTLLSMGSLALFDEFGLPDILLGLALMPGVLVGFVISSLVAGRLDKHITRPAVLGVSALSAGIILVRTWL